ncbi:MAG: hypothetical protein K8T90_14370 [Planctomycetes bacterium]|nr:hypothetical protein [Planctomycetota bacterium]
MIDEFARQLQRAGEELNFLFGSCRSGAPAASAPSRSMSAARKDIDLPLVRQGQELSVYVDGAKLLTLDSAGGPCRPGIAPVGGEARFTDVRYRKLSRPGPR